MLVFWRGNGGLAFVVLAPVILLATGLFVQNLWVRYFGSTALLMLGGWFCYRYGKRWNAVRTLHTLYFIPMQYWGMFYIAVAIGLTLYFSYRTIFIGIG